MAECHGVLRRSVEKARTVEESSTFLVFPTTPLGNREMCGKVSPSAALLPARFRPFAGRNLRESNGLRSIRLFRCSTVVVQRYGATAFPAVYEPSLQRKG